MKTLRSTSGQSLIETIVAIGVIVTGLVGALTLINFTVRSTASTVNNLIAQNLAWEGVEVVLNIRDTNTLEGAPFDEGITDGNNTAIAEFDVDTNTWVLDFSVDSIDDPDATLIQQGGVYRQSTASLSGAATPYKRLITIIDPQAANLQVRSEVQWEERGGVKSISAERVLWDWR